jgi:hypothetical protein
MPTRKTYAYTLIAVSTLALLLGLVLPALLGGVITAAFSSLTLLDPLYAGDRAAGAVEAFGTFLTLQIILSLVAAPVSALAVVWLAGRLRSRTLYLGAPGVALGVHAILLGVSDLVFTLAFPMAGIGIISLVSALVSLPLAALYGLLAAFMARNVAANAVGKLD